MIGKILKNPITILISVVLGIVFGFYEKEAALSWGVLGDVYLNLFQMTVIPILVTSIVASLAQLMKDANARSHIAKILIVFMIMMGICQGMQPIAGYNYGACLNKRLKQVYTLSLKWNVGTGIVGMLLALLIPRLLVMMMNNDAQLISIAVPAMRYLLVMAPLIGFTVTNSQFFQSIDKPWIAIVTSLSRQFIFLIPMMFLVPLIYIDLGANGLSGVWCSCTVSDVLGAALSAILLYSQRKVFIPGYIPPERKPRKERGPKESDK
jgi:Na+-driven multidrug efflux pump